jgi:hypothetical protein
MITEKTVSNILFRVILDASGGVLGVKGAKAIVDYSNKIMIRFIVDFTIFY